MHRPDRQSHALKPIILDQNKTNTRKPLPQDPPLYTGQNATVTSKLLKSEGNVSLSRFSEENVRLDKAHVPGWSELPQTLARSKIGWAILILWDGFLTLTPLIFIGMCENKRSHTENQY